MNTVYEWRSSRNSDACEWPVYYWVWVHISTNQPSTNYTTVLISIPQSTNVRRILILSRRLKDGNGMRDCFDSEISEDWRWYSDQ